MNLIQLTRPFWRRSLLAGLAALALGACNKDKEAQEAAPQRPSGFMPAASNIVSSGEGYYLGNKVFYVVDRDGRKITAGDVVIDDQDFSTVAPRVHDEAFIAAAKKWPKTSGTTTYNVPYVVANDSREFAPDIEKAAASFNASGSKLRWVKRTNQTAYVVFQYTNGLCNSSAGRSGGIQYVNFSMQCGPLDGVLLHEMAHAVGFMHEHARNDRDSFITVSLGDVDPAYQSWFRKASEVPFLYTGLNPTPNGSFDGNSITLYPSYAASATGRPTITRKNGALINQATRLSAGDIAALRAMYP